MGATNELEKPKAPEKGKEAPASADHAAEAKGAHDKLANEANKTETPKADAPKGDSGKTEEAKAGDTKTPENKDAAKDGGKDNDKSKEAHEKGHEDKHEDKNEHLTPAEKLSVAATEMWKDLSRMGRGALGFPVMPKDGKPIGGDHARPLNMASPGDKEANRLFGSVHLDLKGANPQLSDSFRPVAAKSGDAAAENKVVAAAADAPDKVADSAAAPRPDVTNIVDKPKVDGEERGFFGRMWDGAKSGIQSGADFAVTKWKSVMGDTASKALGTGGASDSDIIAKAKENKDITVTTKTDKAGTPLEVMAQSGSGTHIADGKGFKYVDAEHGLTVTRDRASHSVKVEKEGGSTLERFADGSAKVTRPNGDVVTKFNKDHVEITNAKDGTTTVLNGKDVSQSFDEFTIRENARDVMVGIREGKIPPKNECVSAPDATVCSTGDAAGVMSKDGSTSSVQVANGPSVEVDNKTNTYTVKGPDGKPLEGHENMTREQFIQWNKGSENFHGWRFHRRDGRPGVESVDGSQAINFNNVTGKPDINLVSQQPGHQGDTVKVTTQPDGRTHYVFADKDGNVKKDSTVNVNDANSIYDQKSPTPDHPEGHINFGYDPEKGMKVDGYNGPGLTDPEFCLNNDGDDIFGGMGFEPDGGIYDMGSDGKTKNYLYDDSPETYTASTSAAVTASSHGSTAAQQVSAAANGSGTISADTFRGIAIGAIGNVDAAIQQCLTSDNWAALGNLISTKNALISALNDLNTKSTRFDNASKDGLSQDQAFRVAQNAPADPHHLVEQIKEENDLKRNGRRAQSWA